ncbi:hypothetical protein K7X08_026009 [Anisodus acutangulus]|uniref:Uncharacterized protein n=1 Tax=Anisodus acutangulus TaxID=402998 RepID=A0A9Q1RUP9_9SOLA|nr:hypothetical protein K7X08_026009 [Anisodus acutangulus]
MLHCLRRLSLTAKTKLSPPTLEGGLVDDNTLSSRSSPTVNLSKAYIHAVQASSNKEIWSKVHHEVPPALNIEVAQIEFQEEALQLEDVLKPSHEHVQETISPIKRDALNELITKYFDNTEQTARLCILISQNVNKARLLYAPVHKLLDVLPLDSDSLSQAQYDLAFDIFLQFHSLVNHHFPCRDTYNFNNMLDCSLQLKNQIELRLHKSRSKVKLLRCVTRGSAVCLIAATVGVVISAVIIATHGLAALVSISISPACLLPSNMEKKEAVLVQLDFATKGIFFLHNHLNTVKSLVDRLHYVMESYNGTIRFGIESGRDRYHMQEALKQLRRKHSASLEELVSVEEHLYVCFTAINMARDHLLNYLRHQNQAPR